MSDGAGYRVMKDKAMASRMKGTGSQSVIATNGVDRFVCRPDAEFRTVMRCPMCHAVCGVGKLDAHLRGHMAGDYGDESKQAA